jgi:hypothetical protein
MVPSPAPIALLSLPSTTAAMAFCSKGGCALTSADGSSSMLSPVAVVVRGLVRAGAGVHAGVPLP